MIVDGKSNASTIFTIVIFINDEHDSRCRRTTHASVCCRTSPLNAQSALVHLNRRRLGLEDPYRLPRDDRPTSDSSAEDSDDVAGKRLRAGDLAIKDAQLALSALSGGWLRPAPAYSHATENGDGLANLFDDKRSDDMLASSPSASSSESADVRLRESYQRGNDQQDTSGICDEDPDNERNKRDEYGDRSSAESRDRYQDCDPTNFDELADSSSDELEIDTSVRAEDADEERQSERRPGGVVDKQSLYNAYKAATAALPYSTQSAFKPPAPTEVKLRLHGSTLPSEPFGGYSSETDAKRDVRGKHYTVLQPAAAGSRAHTALQEARALPAHHARPLAALSPPASRGTERNICSNKSLLTMSFDLSEP